MMIMIMVIIIIIIINVKILSLAPRPPSANGPISLLSFTIKIFFTKLRMLFVLHFSLPIP